MDTLFASVAHAHEQRLIEQFVAHPPVETLHKGILGWLAWRRVMPFYPGFAAPGQNRVRGQLGTVVAHDHPWLAAPGDQFGQFAHHPLASWTPAIAATLAAR